MAFNAQKQTLEGVHKNEVILTGGFYPNGSSTPATVVGAWISSVAHTATGVWTITIAERYRAYALVSAIVSLRMNALGLSIIQFGAIDVSSGSVIVRVATEGAGTLVAADIAANANNFIDVMLVVKTNNTPDGTGL